MRNRPALVAAVAAVAFAVMFGVGRATRSESAAPALQPEVIAAPKPVAAGKLVSATAVPVMRRAKRKTQTRTETTTAAPATTTPSTTAPAPAPAPMPTPAPKPTPTPTTTQQETLGSS